MKDVKHLRGELLQRDRDSYRDGWSRAISTGWTLAFVGLVVVLVWVLA